MLQVLVVLQLLSFMYDEPTDKGGAGPPGPAIRFQDDNLVSMDAHPRSPILACGTMDGQVSLYVLNIFNIVHPHKHTIPLYLLSLLIIMLLLALYHYSYTHAPHTHTHTHTHVAHTHTH